MLYEPPDLRKALDGLPRRCLDGVASRGRVGWNGACQPVHRVTAATDSGADVRRHARGYPVTVYDAQVIDQIHSDEAKRRVYLGIVIPGPLTLERALLDALTAKVNRYAKFVGSGELHRKYSQFQTFTPYVELAHAGGVPEQVAGLVHRLGPQLTARGIGLATVDLDRVTDA